MTNIVDELIGREKDKFDYMIDQINMRYPCNHDIWNPSEIDNDRRRSRLYAIVVANRICNMNLAKIYAANGDFDKARHLTDVTLKTLNCLNDGRRKNTNMRIYERDKALVEKLLVEDAPQSLQE